MNSFRILSLFLALAALLVLSGLAAASAPYSGQGMEDLSPEKRELAGKLYEDFHNSTLAARQELFAKRRELDEQMYSPEQDEQKIQALAKEIAGLRAQLHSARVALKSRLMQEGIAFGHSSHGPGRGHGCGGSNCGGYGPGMGRGHGPSMRGGGR
jgi:Spy/CpxP family protein refolding chaperone